MSLDKWSWHTLDRTGNSFKRKKSGFFFDLVLFLQFATHKGKLLRREHFSLVRPPPTLHTHLLKSCKSDHQSFSILKQDTTANQAKSQSLAMAVSKGLAAVSFTNLTTTKRHNFYHQESFFYLLFSYRFSGYA